MEKKNIKILIFLFVLMLCLCIAPKPSHAATKLNLAYSSLSLSRTSYVYSGSQCKPTVTVKMNGKVVAASNYTVSYSKNTNPGTAVLTVKAKSTSASYTGSKAANFKITKRSMFNCSITLSQTSFVYNGSSRMPTITVKYNGTTLTRGTHYTINNLDNITNVGNNKRIQIKGIGNFYTDTVTKQINITPASIRNATVTLNTNTYIYDGTAKKPTPKVVLNNTTLINGTDYTVTYKNNTNVGTNATVVITGKGNYKDTAQKIFTIKQSLTISECKITVNSNSFDYDGTAKKPIVTVKAGNTTLVNGTDYTVAYANNINVGTATLTVTGKGKFTGSKSYTYEITRKSIGDFQITLSQTSYLYDGKAKKPSVTIVDTRNNKKLVLDKDYYIINYYKNIEPGTATVRIGGMKNYCGLKDKSFIINKQSIKDCRMVLTQTSYNYNGERHTPGITVYDKNNNKLKVDTDYEINYSNNQFPGTAVAYAIGKGHYKDTLTANFTINKTSIINCSISINPNTYKATGNAITPKPLIKTMDGKYTLVLNKDYTLEYANNLYAKDFVNKDAGQPQIIITGKGNFKGTAKRTFTITSSGNNKDIVAYAKEFIGTPYVWGGESIDGFDCSGFTKYVYAHFGYYLAHDADAQQTYGKKITSINQLQPGDLVGFRGHIGIYVGNESFIHAPATGRKLCISKFYNDPTDGNYYGNEFTCGARILN